MEVTIYPKCAIATIPTVAEHQNKTKFIDYETDWICTDQAMLVTSCSFSDHCQEAPFVGVKNYNLFYPPCVTGCISRTHKLINYSDKVYIMV